MRPDRFAKASRLAEAAELENERRGRGLSRRAELHFQDTFFVCVMSWVMAESKRKGEKLDGLALELKTKWNALTVDQMDRGYSIYEGYQ